MQCPYTILSCSAFQVQNWPVGVQLVKIRKQQVGSLLLKGSRKNLMFRGVSKLTTRKQSLSTSLHNNWCIRTANKTLRNKNDEVKCCTSTIWCPMRNQDCKAAFQSTSQGRWKYVQKKVSVNIVWTDDVKLVNQSWAGRSCFPRWYISIEPWFVTELSSYKTQDTHWFW